MKDQQNSVSEQPKTVRQWLKELPDGYRERAIEQSFFLDTEEPSIERCITRCIIWEATIEGSKFWKQVHEHYLQGTPLPKLPE